MVNFSVGSNFFFLNKKFPFPQLILEVKLLYSVDSNGPVIQVYPKCISKMFLENKISLH